MVHRGIFFLLCFIQLHATAQYEKTNFEDPLFSKYADTIFRTYNSQKPFYVIRWNNKMPGGTNIIRRLSDQTGIISINSQAIFDSIARESRIAAANNKWKFSPTAETRIKNVSNKLKITITSSNLDSLLAILRTNSSAFRIMFSNRPSQSMVIECNASDVYRLLLPLKEVLFIDTYAVPRIETNIIGYDRSFHGLSAVDYSIPGANGKNIVAGVKEQKMDPTDIDLYKRVRSSPLEAPTISNHAAVIASIIGGAGNSFYDGRGIAYACTFFPSSFANLFADDTAVLNTNKVTVQNHSYGTVIQQFYGAEAVSYDNHTWSNKNFVPVFSSGNKGSEAAPDGAYTNIPGFANLTGNFKMAKNIITVGAINSNGIVAAESSAGPTYDGRIAPQLIALGPNGTSDAAAMVSGTVAVMQQVYADSNNQQLPAASLIKAVLYNNAEDIYHRHIDYKTGYGLLDSYESIKALQQKKYDGSVLAQGQVWTKSISLPAGISELKITLSWTDSTAGVNNNKALVNDLDLQVKELSNGKIYEPWVLSVSPSIDSLSKLPVRKRDSLNTAEQVSIALPGAGDYEISVTGTAVSAGSIPFHIAFKTDTLNTFKFISPQHASDVNRDERPTIFIKWKTFVADSNTTGNLYISYTRGSTWLLLQQSLKIYVNQFEWLIPDTATTAILRMETGFGNFFSKEFIISKVTLPMIDFFCTDSFRLSWPKHIYADRYRIYTFADSAYLEPVLTVTDTFIVFQRSAFPSLIYAIEPLLANRLPAARSVAIDVSMQGVQCFYKTLNYNLLDFNKLNLVLELSTVVYADSVFFEKVSANGQLVQTYGSTQVIGSNLVYTQLVSQLPSGTTYLRGRIRLKNGAVVYTGIIPVLTSGPGSILFYPNPASRNMPLQRVLQQGVPPDSRLLFYDASGRLIKSYLSVPDNINISTFPPGVIFFKLLKSDNSLLQTGKLVIR